jgi:hypothetical protein
LPGKGHDSSHRRCLRPQTEMSRRRAHLVTARPRLRRFGSSAVLPLLPGGAPASDHKEGQTEAHQRPPAGLGHRRRVRSRKRWTEDRPHDKGVNGGPSPALGTPCMPIPTVICVSVTVVPPTTAVGSVLVKTLPMM